MALVTYFKVRSTIDFYSTTKKMHLFLKLFILVKRSTCFGRSFRPSSEAQNCTYGNRHMSDSCCQQNAVHFAKSTHLRQNIILIFISLRIRHQNGHNLRGFDVHRSVHRNIFIQNTQQDAPVSQIIYSCKTLYMFRTVFPSIIRSSKLHIRQQAYVQF